MSQHFDVELAGLRRTFTAHATTCFEALDKAYEALRDGDLDLARCVVGGDREIDEEEVRIEEDCVRLITLYSPVAHDLRLIIAILKMNTDLERVADHAANVGRLVARIRRSGGAVPRPLLEMAERVSRLGRTVFQAFLDKNVDQAEAILLRDRHVDALYKAVSAEVSDALGAEGADVKAELHVYRMAREFERIRDHLVNLAEETIWLVTGRVVRHRAPAAPARAD